MKKLIISALAAIALIFSAASCNPAVNADPVFTYDLTATATGKVDFTWFNGGASVDGSAKVYQCNDTTKNATISFNDAIALVDAEVSNDADVAEAAKVVRSKLNGITVNGIQGEYQLGITGYVSYGRIVFAIDEHYPPIDDSAIVTPVLTDTLVTE